MPILCCYMPGISLSVERMRAPHLVGMPVGIASPDETLLVVSEEAKPFGIREGQKASGARGLCERLQVLPYDREAYECAAMPVWDLCSVESSIVEPASPEICYVEFTGSQAERYAQHL